MDAETKEKLISTLRIWENPNAIPEGETLEAEAAEEEGEADAE